MKNSLIALLLVCSPVIADERKQFFEDVKRAEFFDGQIYNCCGEGDAVKARVIASSKDAVAVEIIDPMKHPTAQRGEIVSVPIKKIVKWPLAPEKMGTILFLSVSKQPELRRPYCLVQQRAGG